MPQSKNTKRWELPPEIKLRPGQQDCLDCIQQNPKQSEFVFVLPTGYGKSFVTLLSYQMTRLQGRCNRLLIVVATGVQRQQYAKDLAKDAQTLGIDLLGHPYCARECNGQSWVIKASYKNQCEVFVTTVQSLNPKNIGFYYDLMEKGDWMIVADEAHHYSDQNTWGKAIAQLQSKVRIGLTATPSRSDNQNLVVGGGRDYDVEVTVKEAIEQGALRPFRLEVGDYEVDLTIEGVTKAYTLGELQEEWDSLNVKSVSEWEIKRRCRYSKKYIQSIFVQAYNIYNYLEILYPKQNQILVFAWSCEHAKNIAEQINSLADHPHFADWIGTTGRTSEENDAIMARFLAKDNYLPCLVQVNKASEGFNNPRCSVGIFLNANKVDTPTLSQQAGRLMRATPETSPNAVILVGKDHPLANADLREFGQVSSESLNNPCNEDIFLTEERNGYNIKIPPLSEIDVTVKRLIGFESKYPFGEDPTNLVEKLIKKGLYSPSDKELLLKNILELQSEIPQEDLVPDTTYKERRELIRRQVTSAVSLLVNKALEQTFYPQKVVGSVKGDWFKKTNRHLALMFGKTDDLDIDELKAKFEYVKEVAEEITKTQEVPRWMMP